MIAAFFWNISDSEKNLERVHRY